MYSNRWEYDKNNNNNLAELYFSTYQNGILLINTISIHPALSYFYNTYAMCIRIQLFRMLFIGYMTGINYNFYEYNTLKYFDMVVFLLKIIFHVLSSRKLCHEKKIL